MELPGGLYVRSHVGRDLLQSAALFKADHLVVWEYVSNGLQYVDPGISPIIRVKLDNARKRLTIADNGRGMTFEGLTHFFLMHGENLDRKAGRVGRGYFGTGKSAAFGIAETLVITTVRDNKRTRVSLSRGDIEGMADDSPIPVQVIERETVVKSPNGTLIEIEGVHVRKLDQKRVIDFIERHLAHSAPDVKVWVNQHECQYLPPPSLTTTSIQTDGDVAQRIGKCTLLLRVAATPLSENDRGISIFSKGVWHETTLAGSEGREMADFIFGDIDVPALDDDSSPIPPFDMSRSMRLNMENETVRVLFGFLGSNIEKVRRALVAQERERRASENAKRLNREADEIAKVINEDFTEFRQRVTRAHAKMSGGADFGPEDSGGVNPGDDFVFGGAEPAEVLSPDGAIGTEGTGNGNGSDPRRMNPEVQPGRDTDPEVGASIQGEKGRRRRPHGGFSIDFRQMGEEQNRATYRRSERQIVINLDHPQFKAALGAGGIEEVTFRRLAYEVAFFEYALALALELAQRDEYSDITDPIVEIGLTVNRVARRAASLYGPSEAL